MRYAKDYVSCRFPCPDERRALPLVQNAFPASLLYSNVTFRARPPCFHRRIQPSARSKLSTNHAPFRPNRFNDVCQNLVHRIFIENSQAPVRQQVHLQRLQLDARLSWHIFDRQSPKVRQSRLRAHRRILRISCRNYIPGILVRPRIQLRQLRLNPRPGVLVRIIRHDFSRKVS